MTDYAYDETLFLVVTLTDDQQAARIIGWVQVAKDGQQAQWQHVLDDAVRVDGSPTDRQWTAIHGALSAALARQPRPYRLILASDLPVCEMLWSSPPPPPPSEHMSSFLNAWHQLLTGWLGRFDVKLLDRQRIQQAMEKVP